MRLDKQRGNVWWVLALTIVAGFAVWGAIHAWTSYTAGLDKKAYDRGVAVTTAALEARDNKELQGALARVKTLEDRARADEAQHAGRLADIGKKLEQEKANGKAEKDRIAADIAAGRLVRNEGAFKIGGRSPQGGGSTFGQVGSGPRGGDGGAACELSDKAQGDLLAVGADADEVAKQLAAAQAVIIEDRRLCGALPTPPQGERP